MGDRLDIARAMVAEPGWRWLAGCAFNENATPGAGLYRGGKGRVTVGGEDVPHAATPDLTDPATLGAIEHGLLAPAGVTVFRIDRGGETIAFLAGPPNRTSGWSTETPWRDTLPEALLDGLRAVTS